MKVEDMFASLLLVFTLHTRHRVLSTQISVHSDPKFCLREAGAGFSGFSYEASIWKVYKKHMKSYKKTNEKHINSI